MSPRRAIYALVFVTACTTSHESSTPDAGVNPCAIATTAYCNSNFVCDGNVPSHEQCLAQAAAHCQEYPGTDELAAETCSAAWWNSTCGSAGIDMTPSLIACIEVYWPCGIEGGTHQECE